MLIDVAISGDINEIKKEADKILKYLFPKYCSLKDVHYKLDVPNCMPYP